MTDPISVEAGRTRELIAQTIHTYCSRNMIMTYLDAEEDCDGLAAAIQVALANDAQSVPDKTRTDALECAKSLDQYSDMVVSVDDLPYVGDNDEFAPQATLRMADKLLSELAIAADQMRQCHPDPEAMANTVRMCLTGAMRCRQEADGLAALANDAQSVPLGFALVPIVPSDEMVEAGCDALDARGITAHRQDARSVFRAMIAATHPEAVSQVGETG